MEGKPTFTHTLGSMFTGSIIGALIGVAINFLIGVINFFLYAYLSSVTLSYLSVSAFVICFVGGTITGIYRRSRFAVLASRKSWITSTVIILGIALWAFITYVGVMISQYGI